ncbi:MAG: VOC family protein [Dehalococcoidia bacterium]
MPRVTGLGHVGLYVKDMPKMMDFYSNFLGMYVTDKAEDLRIVFLSAHPEDEHHELALAISDQKSNAQQVSFKVGSLGDLREFYQRIKAEGLKINRVVNHGIAFGCYFDDPEGNNVEVYWTTPIDYTQPHGDPIDLDKSEEELLAILESMPGKPHVPGVWRDAVAGRS